MVDQSESEIPTVQPGSALWTRRAVLPLPVIGLAALSLSSWTARSSAATPSLLEDTIFPDAGGVRAATKISSAVIYVQGNDGGWFYRDPSDTTAQEDGGTYCGTIIRPLDHATNGIFKRNFSGPLSVHWYGARGDNSTDDSLAIQNAVAAAGIGGAVTFQARSYCIGSTITLLPGTHLIGEGWSYPPQGSVAPSGGTILNYTGRIDAPLLRSFGGNNSDNHPHVQIEQISLYNKSGAGTKIGTAIQLINSRMAAIKDVYIASFNIGIEQGSNSWQSRLEGVVILDAARCLFAHDAGEDSIATGCSFRPYRLNGICAHLKNQVNSYQFNNCDMSNAQWGVLLEQGDTSGNGTGTPYSMNVIMINPQFEEIVNAAVAAVASNQNASAGQHPSIIINGGRAYVGSTFAKANSGQCVVFAQHASYVDVRGLQHQGGYSIGLSLGETRYGYTFSGSIPFHAKWLAPASKAFGSGEVFGKAESLILHE